MQKMYAISQTACSTKHNVISCTIFKMIHFVMHGMASGDMSQSKPTQKNDKRLGRDSCKEIDIYTDMT